MNGPATPSNCVPKACTICSGILLSGPPMGKFTMLRWVCAPQSRELSTLGADAKVIPTHPHRALHISFVIFHPIR